MSLQIRPFQPATTTADRESSMPFDIQPASTGDATEVAGLVGALLHEIMAAIGEAAFNVDLPATTARLQDFIAQGRYRVFFARDAQGTPAGFITLYEGYALYAEGAFGTIAELYVSPPLPQFARTLAFYEREGFSISGGRKLRTLLH